MVFAYIVKLYPIRIGVYLKLMCVDTLYKTMFYFDF